MKKIATILTLAICTAFAQTAHADDVVTNVNVSDFSAEKNGNFLALGMNIGLAAMDVVSNQCVLLTPAIVNGNDSVTLPSVAVYGRNRYYHYKRNEGDYMLSGLDEITYMAKDKPEALEYSQVVPYQGWMDGAEIVLHRTDLGCCRDILRYEKGVIGPYYGAFFPELIYVKPQGVLEKKRSLEGQSFVDFPVDQTIIYPEYRNNTHELAKILNTIDTVRNDPDARIDTVWLKGFASPESPYSHNTDLAIGRTAALKKYITNVYDFTGVEILTDYEPEDWEGLRERVVASNLEHKAEILALIDTDMDPDAKEARIKKAYPEEYRFMLDNFYPPLRHTNYKVSYVIRSYSDPKEILKIMQETPHKLDQNEFYLAAGEYEPGTKEFAEVFETAVRMFPTDEAANLNAANAAMRRGDLETAEKYLAKAGATAEAVYARAALAIQKQQYGEAETLLKQAQSMGLKQAEYTLGEMTKRYKKYIVKK